MRAGRLFHRLIVAAAAALMLVAAPASARPAPMQIAVATPARADAARARMNRRVFDAVWTEVRRNYYDPALHGVDWRAARATYRRQAEGAVDDRTLYRVINDMLDLLDDEHAGAVAPAVARRQDAQRRTRPILGLTLFPENGRNGAYVVERVRDGSPAAEAGVAVGWRLEPFDGSGWTPERDVVEGQPVTLDLVDDSGVARPVTLIPREMPPLPAFTADRSRPGVVVLRIEGFEAGLGRWMGEQLDGLPSDTEVIVDLRSNPGGRLLEAEAVLSCFLPDDTTWAMRTSRAGRRAVMKTDGGCGDLAGPVANPVAVLVNGQSRSAAELTPAALQEAGRALVVGEHTAGAVLISQETHLPDGGRLSLSRADFVTARGVRLEKRGVTPDLAAPATIEDRRAGRDPALDAAIAALAVEQARATEATPGL
jgi:carboxyl-terminal processing protease